MLNRASHVYYISTLMVRVIRRTCRAIVRPYLYVLKETRLRVRNGRSAFARIPSPEDEGSVHVLHDLSDGAVPISCRILEQLT